MRRGRKRENEKERERDRQIDGGRDPHSTPSLPTRTLLYALRDPRGGEHRDYRLPPTFSRLSLYLSRRLFTPPTSFSYALAPIYLRTPAPNLSLLSLPPPQLSLRFSSSPISPTPFHSRCRRCISALTSANSRRPARKRRRQTRFHSAPMKWRTTERSPPWRTSSSLNHVGLSPVGDFPAGTGIPMLLFSTQLTFRRRPVNRWKSADILGKFFSDFRSQVKPGWLKKLVTQRAKYDSDRKCRDTGKFVFVAQMDTFLIFPLSLSLKCYYR